MLCFYNSFKHPLQFHKSTKSSIQKSNFLAFLESIHGFKAKLRKIFNFEVTFDLFEREVDKFTEIINIYITTGLNLQTGKFIINLYS